MKKLISILIVVFCLSLVGCGEKTTSKKSHKKHHKEEKVETIIEDEVVTLEPSLEVQGITDISLSDNETGDRVYIDFENHTMTINDEMYILSDEQNEEILEYMTEYTIAVKAKDDEYWPNTEEYPDMLILFDYRVNNQRWDGALCYPDNWAEMIDYLKSAVN